MNDATGMFQPLQRDDPPAVAGYRLAARLGAGGMGRVYLSHTQGGRPVAIKVIRPELADDPAFRRRFGREIKAARRVKGAYTAELIDADADGTPPWLATLYVQGPSLTEAVARRGPLPVPTVLWLMAGVAEALQAVHGVGIVHRDLKPSNVLLAADGPRVIDFGISTAADATAYTATGGAIGTPQFMAPEQAVAGEITTATDVFALGQTAAFAALGRSLYADGPSATVLYRIVHSRPDLSVLPEQLRPLVARCLAADPGERATTAEIVEWCRGRLGPQDAADAWPAVWREVRGPETALPPPVPDPTPALTPLLPPPSAAGPTGYAGPVGPAGPTGPAGAAGPLGQGGPMGSAGPMEPMRPTHSPEPQGPLRPPGPLGPVGQMGPMQPGGPGAQDGRQARRRRTALISTAVATGVLLLAVLGWTFANLVHSFDRGRDASASGPSSSARSPEATGDPAASGESQAPAGPGGSGRQDVSEESPDTPRSPRAFPYPQEWLDEKTSLSLDEPVEHKDRTGDIRFTCNDHDCSLESDTTTIALLYDKPGAGLDACRSVLADAHAHDLPLAAVAPGSEICVKDGSGTIGLLVVQVKSTALPTSGSSFLTADMTVWRKGT
ncbi:protein kinase [Streptomyces sp. NPDC050560]|uniref:protein kinase domain-containing protein n=1 Tax=Streptomyces sp. NPDC050560 TaxID=3365630 RepID=UPI0037B2FE51